MQLENLRVGYFPGAPDFNAPCDRRRFMYYARHRGLRVELADTQKEYDLVVLSQRADVGAWGRYPRGRTKIVFDAIDSYIATGALDVKAKFRGVAKFLTGQSARLEFSHLAATKALCRRADAVICSTDEQRESIGELCNNVHQILDIHDQDLMTTKTSYATGETLHIVWEGLASSGIPFAVLRDILLPLAKSRRIALHLITDAIYWRFSNKVGKTYTADQVRRMFRRTALNVFVYDWNPFVLSTVSVNADLALIPINLQNAFQRGKPENKLLLFWRMGLPVVTSATPAYSRVMERCGLPMACHDLQQWHHVVGKYLDDVNARKMAGTVGKAYAESHHSLDKTLALWDKVFASL